MEFKKQVIKRGIPLKAIENKTIGEIRDLDKAFKKKNVNFVKQYGTKRIIGR